MEVSFYVASSGASTNQKKLDIVANNIANINNEGYKNQTAGFVDLLYDNINRPTGETTQLKQGSGVRLEKTDIDFEQGALVPTASEMDYAINGDGFFAVQNPTNQEIYYTRKGNFGLAIMEDKSMRLVTAKGHFVLDKNYNPITVTDSNLEVPIAVFDFPGKEGFILVQDNLFLPTPRNGAPFLNPNARVERYALESSNVDLAREMSRVIEAQRAFQLTLRMVQTSDEVEQTINGLR